MEHSFVRLFHFPGKQHVRIARKKKKKKAVPLQFSHFFRLNLKQPVYLSVKPKVIGVAVILPQTPGTSSKPPKAPSSNSKGLKILDSEENGMFPFLQPRSHHPCEEQEEQPGLKDPCSAKVLSK